MLRVIARFLYAVLDEINGLHAPLLPTIRTVHWIVKVLSLLYVINKDYTNSFSHKADMSLKT
jgi:hypothetical protein